jgi:hypothetical protein
MVVSVHGGNFQWYFTGQKTFSGILQRLQPFNATETIFPSQNISLPCLPIECGCACARCSATAVFPIVHPSRTTRLPRPAPHFHPTPRHAPSPAAAAPPHCAQHPRCYASCPVPHAQWGVAGVSLQPSFPTRRSWPL